MTSTISLPIQSDPLSYVIWQEQVSPLVTVELLSSSTEQEDLSRTSSQPGNPPTKWQVYEKILRVPYYVTFSRYIDEMQAFRLVGNRYERAELTGGRLVIPSIELSLGVWRGSYEDIEHLWLRWMKVSGDFISLPSEDLAAAQQIAMNVERRARDAEQRAEKLIGAATEGIGHQS